MVTGPLRVVLWVLGSIAVLWLVLGLMSLGGMVGMMGGDCPTMGPGSATGTMGGLQMTSMMGAMGLQVVGMLGLVGIFIYLVVDSLRRRRAPEQHY